MCPRVKILGGGYRVLIKNRTFVSWGGQHFSDSEGSLGEDSPLSPLWTHMLVAVTSRIAPTTILHLLPYTIELSTTNSTFVFPSFLLQGLSGSSRSPNTEIQRLWFRFFHQESWGWKCHCTNEWPMARIKVHSHKLGDTEAALEQKWR